MNVHFLNGIHQSQESPFHCLLQTALVSDPQPNDVCASVRRETMACFTHIRIWFCCLYSIMGSNVFQMMRVLSLVFVRRALSQVLVCLSEKPI